MPPMPVNSPVAGIGRHPRARVKRDDLAEHRPDAIEQLRGGESAPTQLEQALACVARVAARQCISQNRHGPTVSRAACRTAWGQARRLGYG